MSKKSSAMQALQKLGVEVLSQGPYALLPVNLSDDWLEYIVSKHSAHPPGVHVASSDEQMPVVIALVTGILSYKAPDGSWKLSMEQIRDCIDAYHFETALELVNRHSDVRTNSASLDDIFAERLVTARRVS